MKTSKQHSNFGYDAVSGSYLEATSGSPRYHRWILTKAKQYISGTIYEIGAGIGNVTHVLTEFTNGHVVPIEPSEEMFPELKQKLAKIDHPRIDPPIFGTLEAASKADTNPDTCVYINVLEHIEDDVAELKKAYDTLAPGGHVIAFSPALQWLYSPRDARVAHFRRYTKQEKVDKLREAGFEVVQAQYMDIIGAIIWYFKFTLPKSDSISQGSVKWYNAIIVRLNSWLEPRWIPFGKNVLAVGRKPLNTNK